MPEIKYMQQTAFHFFCIPLLHTSFTERIGHTQVDQLHTDNEEIHLNHSSLFSSFH
uniref:Uncharacterized protein n=1 Tax=Octopus bimaculoides TaxID=37653 RepID=A0A0L8GWA4_OCTBM